MYKVKKYFSKSINNLFLIVIGFLWIVPMYSLFVTSFKTVAEVSRSPIALPDSWSIKYFIETWTNGNMSKYFLNSLIISVIAVIIVIIFSSLAAYGIVKVRFFSHNFFYLFIISGLFIPAQILIIPLFHLMSQTHLLNTYHGIILLYAAYALPFCVFLFSGFFKSIPEEISEAAKMDGCSVLGIYLRIIMPLSKPVIATIIVLQFMWFWNEYVFALVFLNKPNVKTITLGLAQFEASYVVNFSNLAAGIIISMVPIVIAYIAFSRFFIKGLIAGSIK